MTRYEAELHRLGDSYRTALEADISRVKGAIVGASQSSIIGVGSGGSYTVASLLCSLHEIYTGRVSRPSTCLELICNPRLASASPIFLISSEGKNPDIVEALKRARRHSARPVHVLTNHSASSLLDAVEQLGDIATHLLELNEKDGYLATKSLLVNATVIARAYSELDSSSGDLPKSVEDCAVAGVPLTQWLNEVSSFLSMAAMGPDDHAMRRRRAARPLFKQVSPRYRGTGRSSRRRREPEPRPPAPATPRSCPDSASRRSCDG